MPALLRLDSCILCATCTCIPHEDILISYQGLPSDRDFVDEDQVTWLQLRRLVVGVASLEQQYPKALTNEAYLTGIVRERNGRTDGTRMQFERGTAVELHFGSGMKVIRGEGASEVVSVPSTSLLDYGAARRIYVSIHERCRLILDRVRIWKKEIDFQQNTEELDIQPELVDRLLLLIRRKSRISCSSEDTWNGAMSENGDIDSPNLPKAYFMDPFSDVHIKRLKPFLAINKPSAAGEDKFNSHLDQWQRALLLVKDSTEGDPLSRLPTEILMHTANFLSAREIRMLCYASNAVAWKLNQAGIWFRKLKSDMPWLWDITIDRILEEQALAFGSRSPDEVDWQAIYFDLREQSIYNSRKRTLSLVNRKRIWNMCLELLLTSRPVDTEP